MGQPEKFLLSALKSTLGQNIRWVFKFMPGHSAFRLPLPQSQCCLKKQRAEVTKQKRDEQDGRKVLLLNSHPALFLLLLSLHNVPSLSLSLPVSITSASSLSLYRPALLPPLFLACRNFSLISREGKCGSSWNTN